MTDFLIFMHIFFVAILLFAIGLLNFSAVMLHRTNDVSEFGVYLRQSKIAGMMTPIATLFLTIFGIGGAEEIGYSLTDGWLIAAYIVTGAAVLIPLVTLKPWGEAAEKLMPQAISAGKILPEQKSLVASSRHVAVELFMNGLLVFVLFDMVFKPF